MTSLQIAHYSLYNIENYKPVLIVTIDDILNKYNLLITEYFKLNIKGQQEWIRGLDTISHVFEIILFYTKNLELTYFHSQKAFYFYVEFIGQITNEQHIFLNLSSRDATLFVYKKTIFDINTLIRKNMENNYNVETKGNKENNEIFDILNINKNIIKNILIYFIEDKSLSQLDKEKLKNIIDTVRKILSGINYMKNDKKSFELILYFVEALNNNIIIENYTELLELFIKKCSKIKPESYNLLREKICLSEFNDNLSSNTTISFINWLFSSKTLQQDSSSSSSS